jgi:hypothetical protein
MHIQTEIDRIEMGNNRHRSAPSGCGSVRSTVDDPRIICGMEPAVPS